jgi:hypothetical protein
MTNDILQSDVDFALKLTKNGCSDSEIVTALLRRRIDPVKAARLVHDLREGKIPSSQAVSPASGTPRDVKAQAAIGGQSSPKGQAAAPPQPSRSTPPASTHHGQTKSPRHSHHRANRKSTESNLMRPLVILALCLAALGGGLGAWNYFYHARTSTLLDELKRSLAAASAQKTSAATSNEGANGADPVQQSHDLIGRIAGRKLNDGEQVRFQALVVLLDAGPMARPVGLAEPVAPTPRSSEVILTLRTNGLFLQDRPVTGGKTLECLTAILGAPSRTNLLAQGKDAVYVFDSHGILLYSQSQNGDERIELDYEALGGTNGSIHPFSGLLKVGDHAIKTDTDSATLLNIRQLALTNPAGDAAVLGGSFNGLRLIFVYLNSTKRLSLAEIDLSPDASKGL